MCTVHLFSFGQQVHADIPTTILSDCPDSEQLRKIVNEATSEYIFVYTGRSPLYLSPDSIERFLAIAKESCARVFYSDYWKVKDGLTVSCPTLEYQVGSVRDDFDFGPLVLYYTIAFKEAVKCMTTDYRYGGLYYVRLMISRWDQILRIPELLYRLEESDCRLSGEKQFDYVDPRNREVQIEMEQVCLEHLDEIGALVAPSSFKAIDLLSKSFAVEASVVIPVRNREKTIAEAVKSALSQETSFFYNVIVVDNHSTDGTTRILEDLSREFPQLIHYIPSAQHLGIGGCWNAAIAHPECGKFAIQLDSDDLYNSCQVVQTMVDAFYKEECAMVVGSYQMVNFNLEEIPPGVIDHKEWTPENGHNNILRVNGLGAPRAFYTPILREFPFPNVNYGEDYAVALKISSVYRIGRIYSPLYLCRRWEENSDANLDVNQQNCYNFYKDKLRTLEVIRRRY